MVQFVRDRTVPQFAYANVEAAFSRGLSRFHHMHGLGIQKSEPVALIGGGPSLNDALHELRTFPGPIFSCGTVHDHLIDHGIVPDFHVDGEPDADGVMLRWLTRPHKRTVYLIASQCPPALFDRLRDHDVRLWHCALRNEGDDCFRGEPAIPGGCFNLMRAWPIAAVMGYRAFHFFGFDCSFPEGAEGQHAYAYDWALDEPCAVICGGRRFVSAVHWLNQLDVFMTMLHQAKNRFDIRVHGDGLVAAAMKVARHAAN